MLVFFTLGTKIIVKKGGISILHTFLSHVNIHIDNPS